MGNTEPTERGIQVALMGTSGTQRLEHMCKEEVRETWARFLALVTHWLEDLRQVL